MTKAEMSRYTEVIMTPEYGAERLACFICGIEIGAGDCCLLIPQSCADTDNMLEGKPYEGRFAHRHCVARY